MFYRPEDGHGLPYNPFNAIVTPRPIGWISTQDSAGNRNLAPYSFFNAVAYVPPQVMFSSTGMKSDQDGTKDSVSNIRETGVFCVNIVEYSMRDAMNASSAAFAKSEDEFIKAGLEAVGYLHPNRALSVRIVVLKYFHAGWETIYWPVVY